MSRNASGLAIVACIAATSLFGVQPAQAGPYAPPKPNGTPEESPTPQVPLIGDLDVDGDVDVFDLTTLLSNFGQKGAAKEGDLNGDGFIDVSDLAIMLSNFGSVRGK